MRLSAILCLLAAGSLLVFEASPANPAPAARTQPAPVVLADHIAASALAVRSAPAGSPEVLYLTRSDAPNQVYEIPVSVGLVPVLAPLTLIAGNGQLGWLGDGGSALAAQFDLSTDSFRLRSGLAASPDGSLIIADTGNATVRRVAGPGGAGSDVIRSIAGRWGPAQSAALDAPAGIALDRRGNLYIADSAANQIAVLPGAASGWLSDLRKLANVPAPAAIAVALDGSAIYAASPQTGAVFEVSARTGAVTPILASAPAVENSCSAPLDPSASLQRVCPSGLAVDGRGNLFIAEASSGQILRRDALTRKISVAASGFERPGDIAFDPAGNLFLVEEGRSRLLELRALGDPASNLSLAPSSAAFPNSPVGSASPAIQFTLSNGSLNAQTVAFAFAGADPADFTIAANRCPPSVPGNSSCTLSVAFVPQAAGPRTAALTAADPNGDSASSTLTGGSSAISFSPATASFGNQPTGSIGNSQTLILTNNSPAAISGLSLSIVSNANPQVTDFQMQSTNCTTVLAPNASCSANVAFSPAATGPRSATLVATDSSSQDSAMTALSGTGDDYQLQLASNQPQQTAVQQGKTVTLNFQVVPDTVFSGTVALSCPPTAPIGSTSTTEIPPYATCTVNPQSVSVSPGTPVPFSVSINTAANTAFAAPPRYSNRPIYAALPPRVSQRSPLRADLLFGAFLLAFLTLGALLENLASVSSRRAQRRGTSSCSQGFRESRFLAPLLFLSRSRAKPLSLFPSADREREESARGLNVAGGAGAWPLVSFERPFRARRLALGAFTLLLSMTAALAGCHHSTPPPSNATPTGTYTLTFQGSAQNATRGVTITLVVTTQ